MDLLERYLQAVGQYLPAEIKADTLAELRANLLAEIDDRAEELERPLADEDVAAILKAHGKPQTVALRYLPQRSLIGPALFPFYSLTITRVTPLVVFVSAIAQGIAFVTSRQETVAHALADFGWGLCSSLLITVAIITAVFGGIEWAKESGHLYVKLPDWDPRKLPAVWVHAAGAETARSIAKRVIDLAVHCLWMAYVLWVPWHPFWIIGPGVFYLDSLQVALAPVWHTFYGLVVLLLVLQLVMKLVAFVPAMQGKLKAMKLATDALGFVAIGILAWHSTYFVASGAGADVHQIAEVNHMIQLAFRVVLVISAAGLVKDVWMFAKRTTPVRQWAL